MDKNIRIAIIGGGIGGLTLAHTLEHFGFRNYIVFEQAPEFKEVGAAISVWPNALVVYRKLGLYEEISRYWGEIEAAYIKTDQGQVLSRVAPKYALPAVCMHRADLLNVLLRHVPQHKLRSNHKLADLEFTPQQQVKLYFEQGAEETADVVVGADGLNSAVRKKIMGDGKPIFRGYNIWRGIAELDVPQGYASETWGKGARVGIVPVKNNKFGWWATLNEPLNTSDEPEGTRRKLNRIFGSWHHPIPDLFNSSGDIIKTALFDRPPHKGWSQKQAVLLGDAAHPTTPNLGQGACMAIEGAYLLANCLSRYNSLSDAFSRYEALHFPRTKQVTSESLTNGKMGQLENGAGIFARNLVIKLLPSAVALKMLDKYFSYDVTQVEV